MAYGLTIQRRFDHNAQSVRNGQESVSGIKWNRRPDWSGMGVRNAPEYASLRFSPKCGSLIIDFTGDIGILKTHGSL